MTDVHPEPRGSGAKHRAFPPIIGEGSRTLILGSMPGPESLRQQRYYAHPQNQFWRILEDTLMIPFTGMPYERRVAGLSKAGIALWDVFEECVRRGSADTDIRECVRNDVPGLLRRHPRIGRVLFNGQKAASAWRTELEAAGFETAVLPSTSPANTQPYAEKLRLWRRALRDA